MEADLGLSGMHHIEFCTSGWAETGWPLLPVSGLFSSLVLLLLS